MVNCFLYLGRGAALRRQNRDTLAALDPTVCDQENTHISNSEKHAHLLHGLLRQPMPNEARDWRPRLYSAEIHWAPSHLAEPQRQAKTHANQVFFDVFSGKKSRNRAIFALYGIPL